MRPQHVIPLTKVDAEKRFVYGIATAEVEDRSKEVCDYAASKPNFEKWSADVHAASGGLSKGNLRAMHGKVAAGKLEEIHFNDAMKQVEIYVRRARIERLSVSIPAFHHNVRRLSPAPRNATTPPE